MSPHCLCLSFPRKGKWRWAKCSEILEPVDLGSSLFFPCIVSANTVPDTQVRPRMSVFKPFRGDNLEVFTYLKTVPRVSILLSLTLCVCLVWL